jgi:LysR family transcriptional regulator, glycine cleavage system transcriptional activator
MSARLPPLNSLRAFEVVSRHDSFRAAAQELHVTAAAVSQQVKILEDHLGRQLLRRHSGGYSLTADALAGVKQLRDGFDQLSAAATSMSCGAQRVLTVSAVPSLAAEWLVPRLHCLRELYPELDVLLHASRELVDLEHSRVDLGIRFGSGHYPGTCCERLFDEEIFPVYNPRLLEGRATIKKPDDLRGYPLIHIDWTPDRGRWPGWSDWLKAAGVTGVNVNKGLRFSDGALSLQAAVNGQGVALASKPLALDHLAAGRLVRPFELSLKSDFAWYVVCAKSRADEPDLLAFRRWLSAEAHQPPATHTGSPKRLRKPRPRT